MAGNFLNGASPRGGALGFRLADLEKLKQVRSADQSTTLLQYIAKLPPVKSAAWLKELKTELAAVFAARGLEVSELRPELSQLRQQYEMADHTRGMLEEHHLISPSKNAKGKANKEDPLAVLLRGFCDGRRARLDHISGAVAAAEAKVKSTAKWLAEPPNSNVETMIVPIANFITCLEKEQADQLLATARRRRAERSKRWSAADAAPEGGEAPPGFPRPRRAVSSRELTGGGSDDAFEQLRNELQRRASARRNSARGLPTMPSGDDDDDNSPKRPNLIVQPSSESVDAPTPRAKDAPPPWMTELAKRRSGSGPDDFGDAREGLEYPPMDEDVAGAHGDAEGDETADNPSDAGASGLGGGLGVPGFSPPTGMANALRWLVSREEEVESAEEIEAARRRSKSPGTKPTPPTAPAATWTAPAAWTAPAQWTGVDGLGRRVDVTTNGVSATVTESSNEESPSPSSSIGVGAGAAGNGGMLAGAVNAVEGAVRSTVTLARQLSFSKKKSRAAAAVAAGTNGNGDVNGGAYSKPTTMAAAAPAGAMLSL